MNPAFDWFILVGLMMILDYRDKTYDNSGRITGIHYYKTDIVK